MIPRGVTERPAPWTDCNPCAGIVVVGFGTRDLIYRKADGSDLSEAELFTLRKAIRARTGDTSGGTSVEEVVVGLTKTWPSLDIWCRHLPASSVVENWKAGRWASVSGNPIATPPNSAWRQWTNNDDFGHQVALGDWRSDDTLFLRDPLATPGYRGDRVPVAQALAFMRPLRRADGTYHTLWSSEGEHLAAVIEPTTFVRYPVPRTFVVPASNRKIGYRYDTKTGRFAIARDEVLAGPLKTGVVAEATVLQFPNPAVKPNGLMYQIDPNSASVWRGLWVGSAAARLGPVPSSGAGPDQVEAAAKAAAALERSKWAAWLGQAPKGA